MSPGPDTSKDTSRETSAAAPAGIALVLVTAVLITYSRTNAFAWDEGYHLVAAWLIAHGKQPYIDFIFPQTPLNAYWNALLLRVLGEDWRIPHTVASLLTTTSIAMVVSYVFRRLQAPLVWRGACAATAAILIGFNTAVMDFHSLQAYGVCLLSLVSALLLTMNAVERHGILPAFGAGVCAGVAAASSLLTAPVAPVMLIWMLLMNRAGNRAAKAIALCAGFVIPSIPLLKLLIESPHNVIFGFLQYQLLYRKVEWDGAVMHNIGEILSWGDSSQAVLLVLLAAAGVLYLRKSDVPAEIKAELYLCAALAITLGGWLLVARPTFTRYFLLTVPFLAIAAAHGIYYVTIRLASRPRPWLAAGILCALTTYALAGSLFSERDDLMWKDIEQTASQVRAVTPPNATLLADEVVYFALRREPPSGMELEDSHKLHFADAEAMRLHLVPRPKLDVMIKGGRFDTVEMCDSDEIERLELPTLYSKTQTLGNCKVFSSRTSLPTKFTQPPAGASQSSR